ncbi:MAG: branched-chain amino acid ABC transporter ATP-binding protein/permease [Rhodospirillales bacterium]|nr:branched-chain amino acid ABC transporter ATP-binding protein/permease [Rhodospirillales bacterium]
MRRSLPWLGALAVALLPALTGGYAITLLNYIGIAAIAALGLVLLTGVGGLTSFGQAAFVGIGAYATGYYTRHMGGSPWVGLLLAVGLAGGIALVLGAATLRLRGHMLPLSTIAWGLAFFFLFGNLDVLGGHNGMTDIPPVRLGGYALLSDRAGYYLVWSALGIVMWLSANLLDSRPGRAIRGLRGGAALVESLGIDAFRLRLAVFVIAGLLAGLSGWLYAHVQRFVSPTSFDVGPSMEYLFMAILGGAGEIGGALLGAALVTWARDELQNILPLFTGNSGQLEAVVFAALFILVLQHARGGLIPSLRRLLPPPRLPLPGPAPALPRRAALPAGAELLAIEGLIKRFGGLVAVNQVGFSLRAGEILGLIGPNGAGKSTLFNLVSGAARPDGGRVEFLGQDITGLPARRIAAHGIARSFQHVRLRPGMSLLENVMLGAHRRGRAGMLAAALRLDRAEEARLRAEAMARLAQVGLDADPHALAGNLALGQQRLLEVARALAADPLLILLDEPAAGLRRAEKQALAELLRGLRAGGLTILLVEHDMEFVMGLVDRVVVMEFGTRIAEGLPEAVRADPRVQDAYLGGAA